MDDQERPGPRAWLTHEDGTGEDVSDGLVDGGFFDAWQQSPDVPQEQAATGWQRSDDAHPPGTGRPAYRVVYKTLGVLPFPALSMEWENLRLNFANGDVERGGMRVPTGIPGRNARHVIIPEHGRVVDAPDGPAYLRCPDLNMVIAGWEETVRAVSYLELLYVPDPPEGPAAEPNHEELIAKGRAGVASLKVLLDLAVGPRLLAMPLTRGGRRDLSRLALEPSPAHRPVQCGKPGTSPARSGPGDGRSAHAPDRTAPGPRTRAAPAPNARLPVVLAR